MRNKKIMLKKGDLSLVRPVVSRGLLVIMPKLAFLEKVTNHRGFLEH